MANFSLIQVYDAQYGNVLYTTNKPHAAMNFAKSQLDKGKAVNFRWIDARMSDDLVTKHKNFRDKGYVTLYFGVVYHTTDADAYVAYLTGDEGYAFDMAECFADDLALIGKRVKVIVQDQ